MDIDILYHNDVATITDASPNGARWLAATLSLIGGDHVNVPLHIVDWWLPLTLKSGLLVCQSHSYHRSYAQASACS